MRVLAVLVVAGVLFAIPSMTIASQAGKNGEHIVVLHDADPTGRVVVGDLTHFGFALVDSNGSPIRHHDASVTLIQNGVVLYETQSAHEYGGIFSLDYTFVVPGPYKILIESDTGAKDAFTGTAFAPVNAQTVQVKITAPKSVSQGVPTPFAMEVEDSSGHLVNHSDILVEIRRTDDGLLVLRTHFHSHTAPISANLSFALPGLYQVTAYGFLAYPSGDMPDFTTVVGNATFQVSGAAPAWASPDGGSASTDSSAGPSPTEVTGASDALVAPTGTASSTPAVDFAPAGPDGSALAASTGANETGAGSSYVLSIITNPADQDGPLNHLRLDALVYDKAANAAVQHVDFRETIADATGRVVFQSESMHEYDGHAQVLLSGLAPGIYTWTVTASQKVAGTAWAQTRSQMFEIVPPVEPIGIGASAGLTTADQIVIKGASNLKAGIPANLTIALEAAGVSLVPHSEVDFAILPTPGAPPILITKVHSHDSPATATVTFPTAGDYLVRADGDSLEPSPTVMLANGGVSETQLIMLKVAAGPGLPGTTVAPASSILPAAAPDAKVPSLDVMAVLGALGAVAITMRRRAL
ncbi:MAG: hypothetical protein ACYDDF_11990 [Thermoplasmatota archaeon]